MLKLLIKKQLTEIFRSYFYNSKKNTARSKGSTVAAFIAFILIMVLFLGGTFAFVSYSMCPGLVQADAGWLYFAIMGGLSAFLGIFGSVFNTYQGLYLSKDNDLLLSMPIPVRYIIISRLISVYLLGLMYAGVVIVPAVIVYWIVAPFSISALAGGILLPLIISVFVLELSCALGWVVAKVSLKLKNKSFVTVLISLLFLGGYYFFYFKANTLIQTLVANAETYSVKIKDGAYGIYLIGSAGTGDPLGLAVCIAVTGLLFFAVWKVLGGGFLKIATASGVYKETKANARAAGQHTPAAALLMKEVRRFTASPTYMLNCGLAVVLMPAAGIALLIKGDTVRMMLDNVFGGFPGALAVLLSAAACLLASMNDTAAPSVSLEGKSIWLLQSLPIEPKQVVLAKVRLQILLTGIPMLALLGCAVPLVKDEGAAVVILFFLTTLSYAALQAMFDMMLGLKMPNLTWTNEMTPIKQSGSVLAALFSGWLFPLAYGGIYLLLCAFLPAAVYLALALAVNTVLILLLRRWLTTKGAARFACL